MKNNVSWSITRLVMVLGISAGLASGISGAAGCMAASDEPVASEPAVSVAEAKAPDSSGASPAGFQVVFQCMTPGGAPVGLPKSPLSACQAACPAGDTCVRCVFQNNAVDCD
jgi:hypothetical protein